MKKSKTPSSQKPLVKSENLFPVIGIGASAGGLDAFKKLLNAIPDDSGMAFVLIQHLDPHHESMLPELLQRVTSIPVSAVKNDVHILPNHIYIIPTNKLLIANDGKLEVIPREEKKNESNLPIDVFFSSLAEVNQSHAIGVVLSGSATDGTQGLKAIKEHGGITFAQDESTAAFDGMPHSAVQAGVVDFILPPEKIPQKIIELTKITGGNAVDEDTIKKEDEDAFKQILAMLRLRKGTDFTYYKQNTIRRRILRRMALSKYEDLRTYLPLIRENKTEQDALYQDLLIPVTSFFREPKSLESFKENVLPQIFKTKSAGDPIRFWVAGCSTGEEAYSIAICITEYLSNRSHPPGDHRGSPIQIFATDINERAIAKARSGTYTKQELDTLGSQRLAEFFTKFNGGYQVNKDIRDKCLFAVHNFLKDPPFGKIDFISCRNVLIYMEPYLQKKALTTFHYSLNPNGFLLLGKSETISSVTNLFSADGKHDKIFSRKNVPGKFMPVTTQRAENNLQTVNVFPKQFESSSRNDFQKMADDIILTKYSPPGVVVNEAMDIIHFRGSTANFLEQAQGKPSHNLFKMARQGLEFELRNILHKAKKEKIAVTKVDVPVQINDIVYKIAIEAIPLPNTVDPHYLILFHDEHVKNQPVVKTRITKSKATQNDKDLHAEQLERELAQTREDIRSIAEDQEAANEELQSANEELLSSNEELQTLNEELETGKEELQSTNEELTVVNQELISANELLINARDYAENIISTIRQPLLVLDKMLRIKSANESFYKSFNVNRQETEGQLIYNLGNRQWNIPELRNLLEEILPLKSSFVDYKVHHIFQGVGERIMLLNGRELKIKAGDERLILLAIEDITEKEMAYKTIEDKENRITAIFEAAPDAIVILDHNGIIMNWNVEAEKMFGWQKEEVTGQKLADIIIPERYREQHKRGINYFLQTGEARVLNKPVEIEGLKKDRTEIPVELKISASVTQDNPTVFIGFARDISKRKQNEKELIKKADQITEKNKELQAMNKELEAFTYVSSHDLQEPLRKIQMFAARIMEREFPNLSENGKEMFRRMQESSHRMQILIQDLLSFSRTNTAERKFEIVNLQEIIDEVKLEFKEAIEEKKAIIEVSDICEANVIHFQFHQLMYNLISNALKFSRPGVPPHIRIVNKVGTGRELDNSKLIPDKKYCHITITDNGIGFEKEFNEKIFEVFQKLHGKDEYAGTGIGLAIVKKIVENHQGIITAESELGKGSRFDIYVPF